ncbi:PIN domain-containing protein [Mucilaginibacter sp. CSA2-8R]|uniref:PIN domain-containing protein n=1 Tax=Mucilaginibacter sp. CSA2-8R TaxID=3141542 RepID=UPI00315DB1C3
MKALLDTNIIIHREAGRVFNQDIGILFKWLDKAKYEKCIHPITIQEINKNPNKVTVNTFNIKLDSYEELQTIAQISGELATLSAKVDVNENDRNDSALLNEVYCNRVDLLISEDKKIHKKASLLGISEKVFTINSFLEKTVAEFPELVNYKVLGVTKKYFGELNLKDPFFDTFREDYEGFDYWFNKKANEIAYVTFNERSILSFLFIKVEGRNENYYDITPVFKPKKRLKIGTFKVVSNGLRLGERFLKIIFDNALLNHVEEIYVTIYDKRDEQKRLINLLEEWGFAYYGVKHSSRGDERVYIRSFTPTFDFKHPKITYPFVSSKTNVFLVPIYPDYHTELLPDSILNNESPKDYIEHEPHRNAISKVYISRSVERNVKKGDIMIFYRTAEKGRSAYYTSVITTIAIAEDKIDNIENESEFIVKCRKRSVFTDEELKKYWNFKLNSRPFIINFLYVYSFKIGRRINRQKLLDAGILMGSENELRGLKKISQQQFDYIVKETDTDESIIVY